MSIEFEAIKSQSRIGMWFDHHVYSLVASLGRLFRKPWATALTVGVMAPERRAIRRVFAV